MKNNLMQFEDFLKIKKENSGQVIASITMATIYEPTERKQMSDNLDVYFQISFTDKEKKLICQATATGSIPVFALSSRQIQTMRKTGLWQGQWDSYCLAGGVIIDGEAYLYCRYANTQIIDN